MSLSAINLSDLPAPAIVEVIDYKVIKNRLLDMLQILDPNYALLLESDPAVKLLEIFGYMEMLIRQRVNDGAKAVMLAFANGTDLEQLGALFGITRAIVTPADNTVVPPTPAVYETDERLRMRIQLAPEALSVCGTRGAYLSHTYNYNAHIANAEALTLEPGNVRVVILTDSPTGIPDSGLLTGLASYLEPLSPLTDIITVVGPTVSNYAVSAQLRIANGPDKTLVQRASVIACRAYIDSCRKIGTPIRKSGLIASLKAPGVEDVILLTPSNDIIPGPAGVGFCTGLQAVVL